MNAYVSRSLESVRRKLRRGCSISCLYSHLRQSTEVPNPPVDDSGRIDEAEEVIIDWPADIRKPVVGIVPDPFAPPSWSKYQRFCRTNAIPFGTLNIRSHDWLEQVRGYDWVVGHPSGSPSRLDELWRKTYVMERWLGKRCYPSTEDLALYEDKHLQHDVLRELKFPVIPTWISYDEADALRLAAQLEYPLVTKLLTGAGSRGVQLLRSRAEAERFIRKVFCTCGRYWCWPYLRQKDYILFQKFILTDGYDVRVMCMGDMMFGYYRKARPGDFRASGSGMVEKRSLPESIVRIAHSVAQALKAPYLSVDFLFNADGVPFITEIAHFNQIETAEQLHVDGVPGAYLLGPDGTIRFTPGRFWVQELALKQMCEQYLRVQRGCQPPGVTPESGNISGRGFL